MKKYFIAFMLAFVLLSVSSCTNDDQTTKSVTSNVNIAKTVKKAPTIVYSGEKGEAVSFVNNQVEIMSAIFDDRKAHYYNIDLDGETVYFFVVKDNNGIYRAAGNACQVCSDTKKGFHQEGDVMVCDTCGNRYPMEKIATEKGGCNPVPINPNLKVVAGKIVIDKSDLLELKGYF